IRLLLDDAELRTTVRRIFESRGLKLDDLPGFMGLRSRLCEIDMRYGGVGENSLFARLDAEGWFQHRVPGVDRIEEAMTTPPPGRAHHRGTWIARLAAAGKNARAEWAGVWDQGGRRYLDLSDPAEPDPQWRDM